MRLVHPSPRLAAHRRSLPISAAIVQNAAEARAASLAPITKRVMDEIDARDRRSSSSSSSQQPQQQQQAGGAGGATTWDALLRADAAWARVKESASSRRRGGGSGGGAGAGPPEFIFLRPSETAAAVAAAAAGPPPEEQKTFDVAVAGGTLGVILAAAFSSAGLRVAVVEAGPLKGREQEWNICREELEALVAAGAISAGDAVAAVVAEFNPVRCAFGKRGGEPPDVSVVTTDVLNLGVSPDKLINGARRALEGASKPGRVFERWPLERVEICSDGVVLVRRRKSLNPDAGGGGNGGKEEEENEETVITARLFVDCMGSGSPAARQARGPGAVPDGVCMVAGTCARGPWPEVPAASSSPSSSSPSSSSSSSPFFAADVIAAVDGAALGEGVTVPGQFFWESFPAGGGGEESESGKAETSDNGSGGGSENDGGKVEEKISTKTTYMFQYSDLARPDLRPSLVEFVEEYWRRVRGYQGLGDGNGGDGDSGSTGGVKSLAVEAPPFVVERVLFGVFYTFRDAPLRPPRSWDRYLPAGDAAGLQSPLSFGGLGSLTRHAARMKGAVAEALACDAVSARDLALINSCYAPNLSGAWMLQRAMAARPEAPPPHLDFVPDLLSANFAAMEGLGDRTLRPFLRDVVRFDGLSATLARQVVARPDLVPAIVAHVGVAALLDWLRHFLALGAFAALATAARPLAPAVSSAGFLSAKTKFRLRRTIEAWEYGSGLDWVYDEEKYGEKGKGGKGGWEKELR